MFECCKCGREINFDPTEETENDGRECPQCGSFFCNECACWTESDDENVCRECAAEHRIEEKRKFELLDLVDNAIFNLIKELNPNMETKIEWTTDGVAEAKAEIRETLTRLYCQKLMLCTEDEFYP